jgi:hypothetical protein
MVGVVWDKSRSAGASPDRPGDKDQGLTIWAHGVLGRGHMGQCHKTRSLDRRSQSAPTSPRLHDIEACDQGPREKGLRPICTFFWVLKHYYIIFMLILSECSGFWSFLGDLEPDLRPDLGRKFKG